MTLVFDDEEIILPIHSDLSEVSDIIIPARSEIIHRVKLDLTKDSVVFNKEIQKGVFLGNSILPKEGFAHIRLLNVNDSEIRIKNLNLEREPLNNYYIINQKIKIILTKHVFTKLIKILNLDSDDKIARDSLYKIFEQFPDIFYIEGETLSTNNFYTQHLSINDETPVYIKNYRLPQTQLEEIEEQVENLLQIDIVEPSVSAYNSPLLIVPKKSSGDKKKMEACSRL